MVNQRPYKKEMTGKVKALQRVGKPRQQLIWFSFMVLFFPIASNAASHVAPAAQAKVTTAYCLVCISHDISDFEGPPRRSDRVTTGFGGCGATNRGVGTLVCHIKDQQEVPLIPQTPREIDLDLTASEGVTPVVLDDNKTAVYIRYQRVRTHVPSRGR